ncbi:MAG: hypothetical protein WDO17_24740 [Alphaproteobacteria bacterium]
MPAKRPRIVVTNAKARKSAVAELILQELRTYGAAVEPSAGALAKTDLLVTTGAEFSAKAMSHAELLILDASEANKKALLSEAGLCTSGDAWAYFVARSGPRSFRIIELPKDEMVNVHEGTRTLADKNQALPPGMVERGPSPTVTFWQPEFAVGDLVSAIFDFRAEKSGGVVASAADPVIPPGVLEGFRDDHPQRGDQQFRQETDPNHEHHV